MKIIFLSGFVAAAAAAGLAIGTKPASSYVAHEWGTFTSVQGADGVPLDWRPLESSRLPKFVYDWTHPQPGGQGLWALSKGAILTLQRMETPVIYFYSAKEQVVDISVRFPQGLITEWYPQTSKIVRGTIPAATASANPDNETHQSIVGPGLISASLPANVGLTGSRAAWTHIEILPEKQNQNLARSLPHDPSGSHYYAARDTGSDLLRSKSMAATNGSTEHEKFIFYRGVGNFGTPLRVTMITDTTAVLENKGKEPLEHLFVLQLRDRSGNFHYVDRLAPGEQRSVVLDSKPQTIPVQKLSLQLGERLAESLVKAGLYKREATAMVKTWNDSWFEEDGMRVLYVLPRDWTDRTLPLTLKPPPRELVRIMVGRAEVIAPMVQQTLADVLTKSGQGDPQAREQAVNEFRKLGRFGEAALRLATKGSSNEVTQGAWTLLQAAAVQSTKAIKTF